MTIELRFVREANLSSPVIAWFGGNLGYSHVGAVLSVGAPRPAWFRWLPSGLLLVGFVYACVRPLWH